MNAKYAKAAARLRLLVALDGSSRDAAVLDEVTRLAASAPLEVTLLRVAHYHTRGEQVVEWARSQAIVEQARGHLSLPQAVVHTLVCEGEVAGTIVAQAQARRADLIVMAGHGHTALRRAIERSMPDWVRRHASVPVVVVPAQRKAA
jgi:nucleotide-binding universal stress UspA family protein